MSDPATIASIVVSGVGSGAVAAALFFSSREVKVLREQLALDAKQAEQTLVAQRAANDLDLMGHTMALDRLFIEFPQLRSYFYEEAEVPSEEPLRSQVISAAELIVDLADSVMNMIRHDQLDSADRESWAAALSCYGRSPAVQMIVNEFQHNGAWREATLDSLRARPSSSG